MARKFVLIAAATGFALASTLLPTGGSQQAQTEPLPPAWIEHLDAAGCALVNIRSCRPDPTSA
jgi:hypothetical protein